MYWVLILSFILLVTVVWFHNKADIVPFEDVNSTAFPTLDPILVKKYETFVKTIYNPFMNIWKKAIISAESADNHTQQPLSSPSQDITTATPPTSSTDQLNTFINNLSQKQGKPFPPITEPLPDTIDLTTFTVIAPRVPTDPTPFNNAIRWMNNNMKGAHAQLQKALRGETFKDYQGVSNALYGMAFGWLGEGFQDTCNDISQCFKDNPDLIAQCSAAIQQQGQMNQAKLADIITTFLEDANLLEGLKENQALVAETKKIQDQAQSGELLNQLQLPEEPSTPYTLPKGSDKLQKMGPTRRAQIEQTAPQMLSLKTTMDQINRRL